jgi:hypothetical protein
VDLDNKLGLEVHDHSSPYPLGWANKDAEIKVTKQCKIKFVVSVDCIDEVELDVVPLVVCGVAFGSPYMYMMDAIFMQRANQYRLIKDGKSYIINAHNNKSKILLVSANQVKKLISSSKKYVLIFLRENQSDDESMRVKASPEGCTKEHKHQLEGLLHEYRGVFKEPKGLPPKRDVDHEIQLFLDSPLPNIGPYKQFVLEVNEVRSSCCSCWRKV